MQKLESLTPEDFSNGQLFLIDKPLDWTSFDVVMKMRSLIRRHCKLKNIKVGHAGTLDPKATGLLIVCTGKFTKQIDQFVIQEKEYTGTIQLNATTPSYDTESEIDQYFNIDHVTEELIRANTIHFIGETQQVAPAFSARFVDGERAYLKARRGEEVIMKAKPIVINKFDITDIQLPYFNFTISCSKGTYIRSVARDFGNRLNVGGFLVTLCRTRIGEYELKDAISIEDFEKGIKKDHIFED